MITFFGTLIRISFHAFRSKRTILSENALLKKENDILLRRVRKNRVQFDTRDKLFFNSQRPHQGSSYLEKSALSTDISRYPKSPNLGTR